MQGEIQELRANLTAIQSLLTNIVYPTNLDKQSSAAATPSSAIKSKTLETASVTKPAAHKSVPAAPAPSILTVNSVADDGDDFKKDDKEQSVELEPLDPASSLGLQRIHAMISGFSAARQKRKVQSTPSDALLRCFTRKMPANANKMAVIYGHDDDHKSSQEPEEYQEVD